MIYEYTFKSKIEYNKELNESIISYLLDSFTFSNKCKVLNTEFGFILYIDDELSSIQFIEELIDTIKDFYCYDKRIIYENVDMDFPDRIINTVFEENDITLYTTHSLVLPVIRANKTLESMFYSYFINIFYKSEIPSAWDYTDYKLFYSQLSNETRFNYNSPIDFNNMEQFKRFLSNGYYAFVWIDYFYISPTEFYGNIHDIHPILVYGFDTIEEKYICKIFNIHKGVYSESIPIDELHTAINSAKFYITKNNDINQICFFKTRDFTTNYKFNSYRFIRELYNYINGLGDSEHLFFYFRLMPEINRKGIHYGMDVINSFAQALKKEHEFPFDADYRVLHLVYEQIKLMYKRLIYISKEKDLIEELAPIINEYKKVVMRIDSIKLLYIKLALEETCGRTFYVLPKEREHVNVLYNKILSFIDLEKNIYNSIFIKIVELLVFADPINKALLLNKDRFSSETDALGFYYVLTLSEEVEVKFVRLFDLFKEHQRKSLSGKLIFGDGTVILCNGNDALDGVLDIELKFPIKTKMIKFYPTSYYKDDISLLIRAYTYNLLINSKIYVSSIFSETKLDYVAKENVLFDTQDSCWIPDTNDKERYIEFVFDEVEEITCVKFRQLANAPRVQRYKVYYYDDFNKCWNCIVDYNKDISSKLVSNYFSKINTRKIRLEITETVYDETGYNVPHVTFFGAFKYF